MQRYRDFRTYLEEIFGERVRKISLDAGMTCPNRDGTLSHRGCVYCDARGSGTGALTERGISLEEQIETARRHYLERYGVKKFIAYFQSFTNTYAPLQTLREAYDRATSFADVVGLAVATRPDCVDPDVLSLIRSYGPHRLLWIEYGLQSAHDATLRRIRRGHDAAAFERAVQMAVAHGLNVCAHVILGLPGEDREMMLQTARFLARLPVMGVKVHLLYVARGTPLARLHQGRGFRCLGEEEYAELVVDFLERIPPHVTVQRLTGDPRHSELVAPAWALKKSRTLALIRDILEARGTWQGRLCEKG